MLFPSQFMGLYIWDDLDDPYDHTQLASNWQAVDDHDHTEDKGKRLPTDALQDGAVSTPKLADNSITSEKIKDGEVKTPDLANGAVTPAKLSDDVWSRMAPLGMVMPWFRPNADVPIPTGFAVCTGQSISDHDWGGGAVQLPDLRDKFITGAGGGVAERATGGANTRNWNHTHQLPDHFHDAPDHNHKVDDHAHLVPDHRHGIDEGGEHRHTFQGGALHSRPYGEYHEASAQFRNQTTYIENFNSGGADARADMDTNGRHTHGGGVTGWAGAFLTAEAGPNTSHTGGTTSGPKGDLTTSAANLGGDIRPAYVGLLFIMKVKNRTY